MGLKRLKYVYISSIMVLIVLVVLTVFRPMVKGSEYAVVTRDGIMKTESEWIIQFGIINREGREQKYNIRAVVSGKVYREDILVPDNRIFTYIYHVQRENMPDKEVSFVIYREGEDVPVKQVSYHLQ